MFQTVQCIYIYNMYIYLYLYITPPYRVNLPPTSWAHVPALHQRCLCIRPQPPVEVGKTRHCVVALYGEETCPCCFPPDASSPQKTITQRAGVSRGIFTSQQALSKPGENITKLQRSHHYWNSGIGFRDFQWTSWTGYSFAIHGYSWAGRTHLVERCQARAPPTVPQCINQV